MSGQYRFLYRNLADTSASRLISKNESITIYLLCFCVKKTQMQDKEKKQNGELQIMHYVVSEKKFTVRILIFTKTLR